LVVDALNAMRLRRLLAVLVLALPVVAFAWTVGASGFAEATVGAQAPRYLDLKESELMKLDREQLAKLLASTMEKANQMNGLWRSAKARYDQLLYVLLGIVAVLSIALSYLLWRKPPTGTDRS
jgi:hypothetical protein